MSDEKSMVDAGKALATENEHLRFDGAIRSISWKVWQMARIPGRELDLTSEVQCAKIEKWIWEAIAPLNKRSGSLAAEAYYKGVMIESLTRKLREVEKELKAVQALVRKLERGKPKGTQAPLRKIMAGENEDNDDSSEAS